MVAPCSPTFLFRALLLGVLVAAGAGGCKDVRELDSPGHPAAEGEGEGEGEGGSDGGAEGEGVALLVPVDPARLQLLLYVQERRTIRVRYVRPDPRHAGQEIPIPDAELRWSLEEQAPGLSPLGLAAAATRTDAQGTSENEVSTGPHFGSATLRVSAAAAEDLVYSLDVVSGPEPGELQVRVEYPAGAFAGERFDAVELRGFAQQPGAAAACAAVDPADPWSVGTASFALPVEQPLPGLAVLAHPPADVRYLLVAVARKAFPGAEPVAVALACAEQVEILPHDTTRITLQLADLTFPYRGRYQAHTFLDFATMLPGEPQGCSIWSGRPCTGIEGAVSVLIDFFSDPGRFVLDVLDGAIGQFFPFEDPTPFAQLLETIFDDNGQPLSSWARVGATDVGDLALLLHELEVVEYLVFSSEPSVVPNAAGVQPFPSCPAERAGCAQHEEWTDLCFNWRQGYCQGVDPSVDNGCGRQCFPLGSFLLPGDAGLPLGPVQGGFDAAVHDRYELTIAEHGLQLDYGAILLGALEKIILPVIDTDVHDLQQLVLRVMGGEHPRTGQPCLSMAGDPIANCCDSLGLRVLDQGGSAEWQEAARQLCRSGAPLVASVLETYLVGQRADTRAELRLGTADAFADEWPAGRRGQTCPLTFGPSQDAGRPRIVLEKLGDLPDDRRCPLRAGLMVGDFPVEFTEGSFYAERDGDE